MYIIVYPIITKWAKEKWISKTKWSMTKPILFFSQFLFQNLWSNLLRLCRAKAGRLAETVSWCPCALSLAHCPGQCGPELSMHMPWAVAQSVRILPAMRETRVQSLGWEDTLEKGMATHSIILAWRIPWTEELEGYSPLGHKESDTTEWLTHSLSFHSMSHREPTYDSPVMNWQSVWQTREAETIMWPCWWFPITYIPRISCRKFILLLSIPLPMPTVHLYSVVVDNTHPSQG